MPQLLYNPETDSYIVRNKDYATIVPRELEYFSDQYAARLSSLLTKQTKIEQLKTVNYKKKKPEFKYSSRLKVRLTEQQRKNKEKEATLSRFKSPPNRLRRWRYKLMRAYVKLLLLEDYFNVNRKP